MNLLSLFVPATHLILRSSPAATDMSVVDHGRPATDDDALDKEVGTPVVASTVDALGEDAKPIDPQMARRVLRKIDMSLMPAMMISKWLNRTS